MSARSKLLGVMRLSPLRAEAVADEILNDHARELAEKIQAEIERAREFDWGKSRGKMPYIQGLGQARRVIDPEA